MGVCFPKSIKPLVYPVYEDVYERRSGEIPNDIYLEDLRALLSGVLPQDVYHRIETAAQMYVKGLSPDGDAFRSPEEEAIFLLVKRLTLTPFVDGDKPPRAQRSKEERFAILARDNFTCVYCGRSAPDVELHIEHVIPISKGGQDNLSNIVTACSECNLGKRAKTVSAAGNGLPKPKGLSEAVQDHHARDLQNDSNLEDSLKRVVEKAIDEAVAKLADSVGMVRGPSQEAVDKAVSERLSEAQLNNLASQIAGRRFDETLKYATDALDAKLATERAKLAAERAERAAERAAWDARNLLVEMENMAGVKGFFATLITCFKERHGILQPRHDGGR